MWKPQRYEGVLVKQMKPHSRFYYSYANSHAVSTLHIERPKHVHKTGQQGPLTASGKRKCLHHTCGKPRCESLWMPEQTLDLVCRIGRCGVSLRWCMAPGYAAYAHK